MRLALAALLISVLALGAAMLANRRATRAVEELRAGQQLIAQQLDELRGAPAEQPGGASDAARAGAADARGVGAALPAHATDDAGATPGTGPTDGAAAERGVEVTVLDSAAGAPSASLDDVLGRFESRFGHGRVEALHELTPFAKRGDERALQALVQALGDEDPRVREGALDAAEELGDPALLPHLTALLDDPVPSVREELADALEEMPMREAGPMLLALLEDGDPDVVAEAAESLGTRAWRPALPALERLLDDPSLEVVTEAAVVLRTLGEGDKADTVVDRVATGVRSPDPDERREALYRVRQVGGPHARPYYEEALRDPEPDLRLLARQGLEALGR